MLFPQHLVKFPMKNKLLKISLPMYSDKKKMLPLLEKYPGTLMPEGWNYNTTVDPQASCQWRPDDNVINNLYFDNQKTV